MLIGRRLTVISFRSASRNGYERGHQSRFEHRGLTGAVAGLTKRPPERILDGGDAWHAHRGGQVRDGGQADGGKASGLEFALYQSNGPAANRSGGDKHNDIRHILFQVVN